MGNHPNRSKQQRKLSDMTDYEADEVMIVQREEYEALKALNEELLAALQGLVERSRDALSEHNIPDMKALQAAREAIAKYEGR